MALHDVGLTAEEAETYMRPLLEQLDSGRQRLDYLRHEIQKEKGVYTV